MKNSKKEYKGRPWLAYYDEEGIPSHLEYPDCSMVDMVIQSAEKWPDNTAYVYYGHKVTYKNSKKPPVRSKTTASKKAIALRFVCLIRQRESPWCMP